MQIVTLLKNDFKKEESRNIDREIALEKRIKQLDNIVFKRDQSAQTVHILTKPQFFYDHTTKQALGFQNPFYLKKAQQLEPKLYDGNVIKNTSAIVIPDSEETLMLAEESHSKMLLKQKDPMMLEKKNYVNSPESTLSSRPTKVEIPKELPKVSMVNTSLKKLKCHLAGFDMVVKERTTPTAITEGSWGFKHTKACFRDEIIPFVKALKDLFNTFDQYLIDELFEVQNVFHQMEQAVEQHRLESKTFEVKMNQVLNENERLLEQVINKDIVNIIMNSSMDNASVNVHECKKCLKLETEPLNNEDFVEKEIYDKLKLKGKSLVDNAVTKHTIDPEMLKNDVEQINPKLLNNTIAHSAYIKHTQEEAAVLRDLVEHVKANYPLDHPLEFAYSGCDPKEQGQKRIKPSTGANGSQPSDNTKKDKIQQTPSSTQKNKIKAHHRKVKSSLKNKDCVVAPKGTANVQHSKLNENSKLKCVKCNGCMLLDNHDLCVLDFINNVNARVKSKSVKKVQREKFGNQQKMITTTTEVPIRKPTTLDNETSKTIVTLVYSRKPKKSKTNVPVSKSKVLKSVSANKKEPSQSWGSIVSNVPSSSLDECRSSKLFSGTVKFRNDHMEKILGYGDYQIGNVTISRVYYMEGLGHNLFSVGQFCDSNLEVAFRQHTCFIRNLEGVDLLTDLEAIISRHGLVRGLPKLKFEKDHLCSACAMGKRKKKLHKPKSEDTNQEKLYLSHMDLCGPMRVTSVNGKKYILVIVDDFSRFTWVKFLRSKDEAPDFIIKFLKMIQVRLKVPVRRIRTDNGTEFVNQTLRAYYKKIGISHETSIARSPQQNGVVERQAVATACYTKNCSIIRLRHGKTPYELLHDKPPDLSFFHVFGALCYLTNDSENLGKLQPEADIGIFIGYAPTKKAFRIYNRRTRRIIETIHVDFDELTTMTSEQSSSGPVLHEMTPAIISLGLVPNPPPSTPFVPPSRTDWDMLFQPLFDELLTPPPSVDHPSPEVIALIAEVVAPEPAASTGLPSSTTVDQDAPSPTNSQTTPETQSPIIPNDVEEDNHDLDIAHMNNDPYFGIPIPKVHSDKSSSSDIIHIIIEAMQEKLNEFERLKVWELVPRTDKVMVITLKCLYKVKLDELGGILKNKARLVDRGYRQEEGIDFEESLLRLQD
ncbi:retrovirus-related pol polyprotein from transposon TNT 1-94 [Tanacetum coccineum]